MNEQIQNYLLFSLMAAINFPGLTVVLLLLASEKGRKKAILFLIGCEIVLLIIGIFALSVSTRFLDFSIRGHFSGEFDLWFAFTLLGLGLYSTFRKSDETEKKSFEGDWWVFTVLGALMTVTNINSLVFYFLILKNTIQISSSAGYQYLLMGLSNIVINSMGLSLNKPE